MHKAGTKAYDYIKAPKRNFQRPVENIRSPLTSISLAKLGNLNDSKVEPVQDEAAVAMLTVLGFDKSESNQLFSLRQNNRADGKPTIVLNKSMGFAKEYDGINRVFDSTNHDV